MARQRRVPTPSWERDHGIGDLSGSRVQLIAIVGVIILMVAALGIGGYALLEKYELKPRRLPGSTALTVGDHKYSVREYTNRTKMFTAQLSGTTNASVIFPTVTSQLVNEAINLQFASEKGVAISEEEIRNEIANTLSIKSDDPDYDTRFQAELTTTGLTEQQYRDFATANVLQTKLQSVFQSELPATIDSVHYAQIVVAEQATADDLKRQIDAGADFGALAAANSTDSVTKDKAGDAGWAPKGFLNSSVENVLFSLDINQVVTLPGSNGVTIYKLLEKDPAHAIEETKKSNLANNRFSAWQDEKKASITIQNEMDLQTGNADKITYVFDHAALTVQ